MSRTYSKKEPLPGFDSLMHGILVGVVSTFEGRLPEEYLRDRIRAIMEANPILGGKVVKTGVMSAYIAYDEVVSDEDVERAFAVSCAKDLEGVSAGMDYNEMRKIVNKHSAAHCNDCLYVLAWENRSENRFSVYFSISHCLGDGHTLYTYMNMLSSDMPVETKTFLRNFTHETKNHVHYYNHVSHVLPLASALCKKLIPYGLYRLFWMFFTPWLCEDRTAMYDINEQYVAEKKSEVKEGFISTNDVITSWWFNRFHASGSEKNMVVNLRGRLPDYTPDMMGNYLATITFSPELKVTPEEVRRALQTRENGANTVPNNTTYYQFITRPQAYISNWSVFYHTLSLPGGKYITNAPAYIFAGMMPKQNSCIVFKRSPKQHAVVLDLDPILPRSVRLPTPHTEAILRDC